MKKGMRERPRRKVRRQILRDAGIYGYDGIEDLVLACLALGEPLLLVGGPGSAKTTFAERLAAALKLRFWAYDASKALFEDVLGPFDPRGMMEGRVAYLQTDLTIWDKEFVLIDELSRANPSMQNKWLEVIQSRRVMGKGIDRLRFIVAAMNPTGLLGTMPLDEALAGRFTVIARVPEAMDMNVDDRRKVILNRSGLDGSGVAPVDAGPLPDLGRVIGRIRAAYPWAERVYGATAALYVDRLADYLKAKDALLDGRRLGKMYRALVALVATHRVMHDVSDLDGDGLLDLFLHGLEGTLPFETMGRTVSRVVIDGAHDFAAAAVSGRERRLLPMSDLLAAARRFIAGDEAFADPDAISLLVTRVAAATERPTRTEVALQAGAALVLLVGRQESLARVRPEARHRLMSCWRELSSLTPSRVTEFVDQSTGKDYETRLDEATLATVLRMAFNLASRLDRLPNVSCSFDEFGPKLVQTIEGGAS
jgi:MoxR-like ATPase